MFAPRENCEITFDKCDRKFYPNQVVSGRIKFEFSVETTLRGIYYTIHGKAYCNWTQGTGLSSQTFIGRQILIEQKNYLVGNRKSELSKFEPGEYSYSFSTALPAQIPISFDGAYGYVRYKITVGIDRPFRLTRRRYEQTFTVVKEINLNHIPHLRNPIEVDQMFKLSTFFFSCLSFMATAPLTLSARLAHGGYAPGQEILIDLNMKNRSGQIVKSIETALVKIITCRTSERHMNPQILETQKLIVSQSLGCSPYSSNMRRIGLVIPEDLQPTETTSYCCRLEYEIRINGKVNLWQANPILRIPILIGTVPIDNGNFNNNQYSDVALTVFSPTTVDYSIA